MARLRNDDQALVAPLEQVVLRHVVQRNHAEPRRPADDPDHGEGIGQPIQLVDVVAQLAADADVARASDLFGYGDLAGVLPGQASGDDPIPVEGEQLRHPWLVDPVEIELGVAGQQIDIQVRVGVALDERGPRDVGAVGEQLVEPGLRLLDRSQARGQPIEGAAELVDGGARRRWQRQVGDILAGAVQVRGVPIHRLQRLLQSVGIRRRAGDGQLQPPQLGAARQHGLQEGLMLLQIGGERSRVVRILGQLVDQLVERLLLGLKPLHPNDQVAERNEVTAQSCPVIARIGGIDLEALHRRQLRPNLGGQRDDGVVVRGDAAWAVERVHLQLDVVQARQ